MRGALLCVLLLLLLPLPFIMHTTA